MFKLNYFKFFQVLAVLAGFLASTRDGMAQYYSNETSKQIVVVDKKIKLPGSETLKDNISANEYLFKENDQVEFAISVTNRGNETIRDLNIVDTLPKYLNLQYFFGKLDDQNRLNTKLSILNPGEVKNYYVIAIVKGLPTSETSKLIKLVNNFCASNNNVNDCDKVTYYAGSKTMPVTGSNETLMLNSVLVLLMGGTAMGLRKYLRGY